MVDGNLNCHFCFPSSLLTAPKRYFYSDGDEASSPARDFDASSSSRPGEQKEVISKRIIILFNSELNFAQKHHNLTDRPTEEEDLFVRQQQPHLVHNSLNYNKANIYFALTEGSIELLFLICTVI